MLSRNTADVLGSTDQGTSFADIIINNVKAVAEGQISGFQSFLHDPKPLKETVEQLGKMAFPKRFIEAVTARRVATDSINSTWRCPLNLQTPLTCPIPWTIIEAQAGSQQTTDRIEFQIMRTVDFIGRNYIRIELPEVDTTEIVPKANIEPMTDPDHMFLGAWHRDLVPRIINKVEFYPRSSQHKLFTYTGYDIAIHNIIFGNSNKEMNDLMAGEDKFELAYDPYRVDGTALGVASFKGIDTFKQFVPLADQTTIVGNKGYTESQGIAYGDPNLRTSAKQVLSVVGVDNFKDSFQLDTTMDDEDFKNFYRRNVWYEAPVAVPYDCRHSIHSRRFFHRQAVIIVPLDVLPFGYSIESSLPSTALAGDCGFISITKWSNWFDRSFYLTKLSDVPSLHPIVQHTHYAKGDYVIQDVSTAATGATMDSIQVGLGVIQDETDPRCGWVNERSVGQYGKPEFVLKPSSGTATAEEDGVSTKEASMYDITDAAVVGKNIAGLEGVIPTVNQPVQEIKAQDGTTSISYSKTYNSRAGAYGGRRVKYGKSFSMTSTSASSKAASRLDIDDVNGETFLRCPSSVDKTWNANKTVDIRLLQTGYMVLPSIKALLTKLPNIYLTTEWDDMDISVSKDSKTFQINNDLYIMALLLWFIPEDSNGIPSMRVYPHHKIDTEFPLVAGIRLKNEQAQGKIIYTWDMMNLLEPAHMNLAPLLSNMGIISFTPIMQPNCFPYAVYDQNLSGYIEGEFMKGEQKLEGNINIRSGVVKVTSIGINGIALLNLSMYRLVF